MLTAISAAPALLDLPPATGAGAGEGFAPLLAGLLTTGMPADGKGSPPPDTGEAPALPADGKAPPLAGQPLPAAIDVAAAVSRAVQPDGAPVTPMSPPAPDQRFSLPVAEASTPAVLPPMAGEPVSLAVLTSAVPASPSARAGAAAKVGSYRSTFQPAAPPFAPASLPIVTSGRGTPQSASLTPSATRPAHPPMPGPSGAEHEGQVTGASPSDQDDTDPDDDRAGPTGERLAADPYPTLPQPLPPPPTPLPATMVRTDAAGAPTMAASVPFNAERAAASVQPPARPVGEAEAVSRAVRNAGGSAPVPAVQAGRADPVTSPVAGPPAPSARQVPAVSVVAPSLGADRLPVAMSPVGSPAIASPQLGSPSVAGLRAVSPPVGPVPLPPSSVPVAASPMPTGVAAAGAVPFAADLPAASSAAVVAPAWSPAPPAVPAAPVVLPALHAFGAAIGQVLARERKPLAVEAATAGAVAVPVTTPATSAPVAAPDTPLDTGDRRWPDAMVAHIERLRDAANETSTRIRLLPDALGPVDVAVRRDGDTVHVHFTAAQAETRQLLADAQPRLQEAADARGLKLGRSDVSGGQSNGGGLAQDRQAPSRQPTPTLPTRPAPARVTAPAADDPDTRLA